MITPPVEPVNFDAEAEKLASTPKEKYVDLDDTADGPADDFMTEEQYDQSAQESAPEGQPADKYRRAAKMAFNLTDMAVPRVGSMVLGGSVSHKELQAKPDDHEDIINAYAAVFEHYDYDFNSPVVVLMATLGMVYGIPMIEKADLFNPSRKKKKPRRADAVETVHAEDVEDAEQVEETTDTDPEQGKNYGVETMEVVADLPSCDAPGCAKLLKKGQKKYCSKDCRMKALNSN